MDKTIKNLRLFFAVSTAAIEFADVVRNSASDNNSAPSETDLEVKRLHQQAFEELEKESPDMGVIDGILIKLEQITQRKHDEKVAAKKAKFKPGGLPFNAGKENEK